MAVGTVTRQLALEYEGDLDFTFVVESVDDAAHSVLTHLSTECQVSIKRPRESVRSRVHTDPEGGCRTCACESLWRASADSAARRSTIKWQVLPTHLIPPANSTLSPHCSLPGAFRIAVPFPLPPGIVLSLSLYFYSNFRLPRDGPPSLSRCHLASF